MYIISTTRFPLNSTLYFPIYAYISIAQGDVRHITRQPLDEIRLGSLGYRQNLPKFNQRFKNLFAGIIFDPSKYLKPGFPVQNLCVLACIILGINLKMGSHLVDITARQVENDINTIPWGDVVTPDATGIPLRKMSLLEEKLNPIPPDLIRRYPGLQFFNGICVNVFQLRTAGSHARLFPVSLGKQYKKIRDVLQIDLIIDDQQFRDKQSGPIVSNHCLLLSNITLFLHKNQQKINTNKSKNNLICRGCMKFRSVYYRVFLFKLKKRKMKQKKCTSMKKRIKKEKKQKKVDK